MAIQYKKHFTQDLTKDVEIRQNCGLIVFNKDNLSEIISVDVFDNGQPVTITGSVVGAVIRANGTTVPIINGTFSGNTASITLTAACCAIPGQIGVGIQIISDEIKATVLKAIYNVELFETDNVVDPGSEITLGVGDLIAAIDAAIASIPPDYSSLSGAVSKYESLTNAGVASIVKADLESGYWGYSTKMANSKRLRCSFLIPVRAGMVVKYSNPTMRIYFGVLATTTSLTYLQYTGWLAAGATNAEYKINYDGYMTFMVESTDDIDPDDFDSTVTLTIKNLPLTLMAYGASVYNASSAANYFGSGLDADNAPVNTYVSVLQTGLGIAHLPGDSAYVQGMLVTLCTDANQARTTGKAQIYITSSGMKTRVLLASAWSAWI